MNAPEHKVTCPHCGAENPASALATACTSCGKSLRCASVPVEQPDPAPPPSDEAPGAKHPTARCPKCREFASAAAERCAVCGADLRRIRTGHRAGWGAMLGLVGLAFSWPIWACADAIAKSISRTDVPIKSVAEDVRTVAMYACWVCAGLIVWGITVQVLPPLRKRKLPPPTDDGWRAFAQQLGASLSAEGDPSQWSIEADHRGWTVVIDTYTRSVTVEDGDYITPQGTRCRVSYVAAKALGFRAFWGQGAKVNGPGAARGEIAEQAGELRDIATWHPLFDESYTVRGADEKAAKAILESARVRQILLHLGEGTDLRVERLVTHQRRIRADSTLDETPAVVTEGPAAGVYVLCLEVPVLVVDSIGLQRMHELVHTTLDKLCELCIASEEPPATHLDGRPRRAAHE